MSINVTKAAVTLFDAQVKKEYQSMGWLLRDTIRMREKVIGEKIRFTISSQVSAQPRISQDDVPLANVDYRNVEALLTGYTAPDLSDIFDQQEINFDEKRELAQTLAMAIGRRNDQIVIDALDASATINVIPDGGTGFTFDKFLASLKFLRKNAALNGGQYLAISAEAEEKLLTNEQLTSIDFVKTKAIQEGGLHNETILGFTFKVIPDMPLEGGLPKTGDIRTCFAWNKEAVGMGIGIDMKTRIDWVPMKTSWLVNAMYKAGATAIDDKGIVKIEIDESV